MDYNEITNRFFRESPASGLKKLDKKFNISLDNAFKDDNDAVTINCSDIKKKPSSKPSKPTISSQQVEQTRREDIAAICAELNRRIQEGDETALESIWEEWHKLAEQAKREHIAAICAESGRTQEWAEASRECKEDHYECEMCGETSDIEAHDILPYSRLTEGQRHDRDFLKQNLISLCHKHHHTEAHLGDPDWIKFNPRIREISELHLRQRRLRQQREEEREKRERYVKRRIEHLRLICEAASIGNERRP